MRTSLGYQTALLLACLLMPCAVAEKGDLTLDIKVNHGAAYREGSWAPVDVLVHNESRDISGCVEVRLYNAMGELLSPVYRVAAESPNPSTKRFRLHCKLAGVDRIEAQLYHGWRRVNPMTWIRVQPIRDQDFLALVLDDEPEDYVFLSTALFPEDREVRFHRETLTTAQLGALADYPQCYEPFDLIILGRIDPAGVAERHRDLLRQYVESGGTLVVCLGEGGAAYRDSWLEELLGTDIGPSDVTNAYDLATQVFPNVTMDEAHRQRQGVLTRITPVAEGVETVGESANLATIQTLGRGRAIALAVDAGSGLLHAEPQYRAFWRDLSTGATRTPKLDLDSIASLCAMNLPRLAGVTLFPVSSVITYLVLYFVIAIVLNWIFWSIMKRREYAWLCLVFFSIGFTGYAMFFGTRGRAKSTELERIEVLQVPAGGQMARSTVLAGVLAAGSGRFSGSLVRPTSLVDDLSDSTGVMGQDPYGGRRRGPSRPFEFVQDNPARVENIRIGASEMRLVTIESYIPLDGAVEGVFTLDADRIRCEVKDHAGLNLREANLFYGGRLYPLRLGNGAWQIDTNIQAGSVPEQQQQQYYGYNMGGDIDMFRRSLRDTVIARSDGGMAGMPIMPGMQMMPGMPGMPGFGGGLLPPTFDDRGGGFGTTPLLVAWADQPETGVLDMDQEATEKLSVTLLVAELSIVDTRKNIAGPVDLMVVSAGGPQLQSGLGFSSVLMSYMASQVAYIEVPEWTMSADGPRRDILVALEYKVGRLQGGMSRGMEFTPDVSADLRPPEPNDPDQTVQFSLARHGAMVAIMPESERSEDRDGMTVRTRIYRLKDWATEGGAQSIPVQLVMQGESARNNSGMMNYGDDGVIAEFTLTAQAVPRATANTEGD